MAGPYTEAEVITGWATGREDFAGANAPNVQLASNGPISTIDTPGWRTLWQPCELMVFQSVIYPAVGMDGRSNWHRFVSPGAQTYMTDAIPTKGCSDIMAMLCVAGDSGAVSEFKMYGQVQKNPAGGSELQIAYKGSTTATAPGAYAAIGTWPNAASAPEAYATWPYIRVQIVTTAANMVLTLSILGR